MRLASCLALWALLTAPASAQSISEPMVPYRDAAAQPARVVAVTFDDLPLAQGPAGHACDGPAILELNRRLIAGLARHGVPATAFVTEGNVCDALRPSVLPDALTQWLDSGHDLANHTFSHPDFNRTGAAEYTADVERGAATARRLLEARGRRLRYFRPPYLRTGDTPDEHAAYTRLVDETGYVTAPVTLDNDEWAFAAAYARALARGDTAGMERIGRAYAPWLETVVAHHEARSLAVLGYEPPQVLLLHANWLNADHIGSVAEMLVRRGYRFVTLDEAMVDPAYGRPDTYVGARGVSWIHRWGIARGLPVEMEPAAPAWVGAYGR
ncbi:MAG TPA: polysaccharide deacetylase family protein [Rubricoccaceae bacterium]|jgi:peptidoglycan/xylan/chitin deacetylase (PgdA/CDA1 family)